MTAPGEHSEHGHDSGPPPEHDSGDGGADDPIAELVAQCDAVYHDLDFQMVDAWKELNPEGQAIGCLPIYVPRELIHAAGMLPVTLRGAGDQLEIIRGDAFFQSYICHMPRGVVEMALSKRLDNFDGFVFPAICDVIRNLSGIWKLLFEDQLAYYLDVPQNFEPEVGGAFYAHELARLQRELEKMSGRTITDDALRASIAVYNENRAALRDLLDMRVKEPWRAPALESYLVIRAGDVVPVEEHTDLIREYLRLVAEADRPMRDHTRVRRHRRLLRAAAAGPHQDPWSAPAATWSGTT